VGGAGSGWRAIAAALDRAAVVLAAEHLGGLRRVLSMSVDYACLREQFGRPIGSFQAIRHLCADTLVDLETARSVVGQAVGAFAREWPAPGKNARALGDIAKAYCSDAYTRAAAANIQIHGGIGFTWEHPAHLYYKRARSDAMWLGDAHQHRLRFADRIGL
jgi:alkylation response protein AidB-like acyl-CoA dehydrogenase